MKQPVAQPLLRRLLGKPLPRADASAQRLPSVQALPILSSDALSSVAYATEAALGVLVLAGSQALGLSLPITAGIVVLIAIVVFSYRQTIEAYPREVAPMWWPAKTWAPVLRWWRQQLFWWITPSPRQ